mmetsp:Transcript_19187/g.29235  ORF Transcript_19187/g.29235 Transcript_19187/m.29235 type:complete len:349 (-) Transcript_19187:124-1170(-)
MATTATTSMTNDTTITIPSTPPSSETEERNAELWELLRRSKRRVAQMHAPRIKEEEDSDGDDDDVDNNNDNNSDDDGTKSYKTTTPESMSASPFSPSPNNSRDFQQERREIEGLLQKSKQRLSYGYELNKLGEKANDIVEDAPEINMKTPKKEKEEEEQKAATTPETPATPSSATTTTTTPNKYNRAERKNRKMMQKMGMRKVSGITHATFQTSYHGLFYIERPDVYTSASNTRQNTHNYKQTFIIFGVTYQQEADDSNEQQQQQQEHHQNLQQVRQAAQQVTSPSSPSISVIREEEECDGELDDGSDLDPTDIDMVVKQGFCTRTKAIQALRTHEDIVDAVMALRIE